MQWIGLGKIAVTTPGTPVVLAGGARIKANALLFTFDPADAGSTVYIKDNNGNIMAPISNQGSPNPILFTGPGSDVLNLANFLVDASAGGKGPYVCYGVA